eukprot:scaffold4588_cov112-Isochrysis_galbana.AAC.3
MNNTYSDAVSFDTGSKYSIRIYKSSIKKRELHEGKHGEHGHKNRQQVPPRLAQQASCPPRDGLHVPPPSHAPPRHQRATAACTAPRAPKQGWGMWRRRS